LIDRLTNDAATNRIDCLSEERNGRWALRLSNEGELVLHKPDSQTSIHDEHFDQKGRLVVDGFVIMHRCHGF
jgi:hypothetical protein